ncbi:hypothetical protein MTP99_011305 [Tenebrio molitor]|nr:hypothetical protein MTP99_011305 [Tenebrio molitor]
MTNSLSINVRLLNCSN